MKKDYIRLVKKIMVIAGILVVIDLALTKLFQHFYFKLRSGESAQTTYAVTKATDQWIVFGSSRAVHHYIPSIIEDSFALSCYNAGKDGQGILYQYGVLKSILSRTTPKVIIIDADADEFRENEAGYGRLSALLPYYYSKREVQDVVNERSRYERIKTFSGLYRYNSLFLNTFFGNLKQDSDGIEKGYKPLDKLWNKPLTSAMAIKKDPIDSLKVNYFKRFIEDAKKRGSDVFVVVSPVFEREITRPVSLQITESICKNMGATFIDARQDTAFISHPEFFADIDHLNEKGALVYTKFICNKIKQQAEIK